jgi:hypothetical protein
MSVRESALGTESSMLGHHAAILNHADAGPRERRGGAVVADAELEPDRRRPPRQGEDFVRVTRQVLGAPKDLAVARRTAD